MYRQSPALRVLCLVASLAFLVKGIEVVLVILSLSGVGGRNVEVQHGVVCGRI
jgi:hypothetical protein